MYKHIMYIYIYMTCKGSCHAGRNTSRHVRPGDVNSHGHSRKHGHGHGHGRKDCQLRYHFRYLPHSMFMCATP